MRYVDINNNLKLDKDYKAVENSVHNILSTRKGSVPGVPNFGSNLYSIVFNQLDPIIETTIKNEIVEALEYWEPRIDIKHINIIEDEDYNRLKVFIGYEILYDVIQKEYEYLFVINK